MSLVVLTYGQLFEFTALYSGQPHVATCDIMGLDTYIYSTGRLEQAEQGGSIVYVVSSHTRLQPHDDWWASRLAKDDIYLVHSRADDDEEQMSHVLLRPWRRLYRSLGGDKWKDVKTVERAKELIAALPDVLMGSEITPWNSKNHP